MRGADGVVAEICDALAEQVAMLGRGAPLFVSTFEAHSEGAGATGTRFVGGAVAARLEASGQTDAPVADVRWAIVVRHAQVGRAFPMNAAVVRGAIVARDATGAVREVARAVATVVDRFANVHVARSVPARRLVRTAFAVYSLVVQVWLVRGSGDGRRIDGCESSASGQARARQVVGATGS